MSLKGNILKRIDARLPKVLDARAHGALDYLQAAFFLAKAWQWRRKHPHAAVAALLTGSFVLTEALFTDYPLGVVKVLPFPAHKRIDAAFAAVSTRIPKAFGLEDTPASAIFKGNTVLQATVVGITDYEHAREHLQKAA